MTNFHRLFTHAIGSYREIQRLLTLWEHETAEEILNPNAELRD